MTRSPAALRALLVATIIAASPGLVAAQVLYKWTDNAGRTQYSDQPPKNFAGPVTRIEPDEKPTPSAAKPGEAQPAKATSNTRDIIDMAEKKRVERDRLEANLNAARARLAAAKSALDNAAPGIEERMAVQQRQDAATPLPGPGSATTGGMFGMGGMNGTAPRSNCNIVNNANGTPVQTCRTLVPSETFYDRVKALKDEVKSAEDAVAEAETAYRRGVD